jgi:hypothetical protein
MPNDDLERLDIEALLERVYGAAGKLRFEPGMTDSAPRRWTHWAGTSEHHSCVAISADRQSAGCLALGCTSWFVGGRKLDLIRYLRESGAARLKAAQALVAQQAPQRRRDASGRYAKARA